MSAFEFCKWAKFPLSWKWGFFVDFVASARGRALKCTSNLSFVLRIVHVHFDGYWPNGLHESASTKVPRRKKRKDKPRNISRIYVVSSTVVDGTTNYLKNIARFCYKFIVDINLPAVTSVSKKTIEADINYNSRTDSSSFQTTYKFNLNTECGI